ncbi:MAG: hypothetical protein JJU34_15860 [Lunatimonas sp.]|uniref:hypothetical protein n=1 Tax=Lunatimonas sp. TaxID=2060141 RepID=UPI00263AE5E8|nr:hypothetical protein [Lunatimonas sp.]MCC5938757.1 hypothetical protein [Lunatimonas sp.]
MKFTVLFVTSAFIWFLLGSFIPYWGIMAIVFLLAIFVRTNGIVAFLATGLGVGAVWLFLPLYIWVTTDSDLPNRMGEIVGLSNSTYLLAITGMIGFLLGGFSGLTGNLLGRIFHRDTFL